MTTEPLTDEDWYRILDIDLTGVMRTVRAAAHALPVDGSVVVVSSIAGAAVGWAGHTPYTSAKAGLIGLVRSAQPLGRPEAGPVVAVRAST